MLLYVIGAIIVLLTAALLYHPRSGPPRCAGCGTETHLMTLDGRPICAGCYQQVCDWRARHE